MAVEAFGKCGAVAETVARHVYPSVVEAVSATAVVGLQHVALRSPFSALLMLAALDAVVVLEGFSVVVDVNLAVPIPAVDGSQPVLTYCFLTVGSFLEHVYQKFFSEDGLVVDMKVISFDVLGYLV